MAVSIATGMLAVEVIEVGRAYNRFPAGHQD
jgi:hypothetical protein